ncbi:flagellar protein FlaG [Pseudalkalibacillus sp. Hm43]|uniref:flagellar protein FlaG n=1 Tax=Pseudalkalibacillus sp. Hm43 TaxID=3450742 RepID=UPI003F43B8BC
MSVGNAGKITTDLPSLSKIVDLKYQKANKNQNQKTVAEDTKIPKEVLQEKVESMNEFLVPTHTSLRFQLHEQSEEYYVQVIDDKSKEVIREIPDRKFLDMYAAMAELVGIVVDKKI